MKKINRCVVRNQAYQRGQFSIRERHNERKNEEYGNGDIIRERSTLNVCFKSCPDTYAQEFSRMVDSGEISLRGLKPDAKVFDELVFDVNSAYFENHGGYEYAKKFFAEAYQCAVREAGGEQYVLSAVLHADERNKALSEQLGRDVFHYHLHVVYVPVVDKEIYFKKNNKNPELAGKLREVIKQVSHSKKWPRFKDENGKWVNSYSLLQDRFFEHMREAGFTDFERGERGSTTEHLDVLDYKIQQDTARAAELCKAVESKRQQSEKLDKKLAVQKKADADIAALDTLGKKNFVGQIILTPEELKTVKAAVKRDAKSQETVAAQQARIADLSAELSRVKYRLQGYEGKGMAENLKLFAAQQRAPRRFSETVSDIMHQPPERQAPARAIERQKSSGLGR